MDSSRGGTTPAHSPSRRRLWKRAGKGTSKSLETGSLETGLDVGSAPPTRAKSKRQWLALAILAPLVLAGCQVPSFGAYHGATTQGQDAYKLWQFFFIAGLVVGGFVLLLILWAVFRYRKRKSQGDGLPVQSQYHTVTEILYTIIPILIVVTLFVFTVITENEETAIPRTDVLVQVTAFQWGWQFYYPLTGKVVEGAIPDAPQMVVPTGEAVTIHLKTVNVIHGFYVPEFNWSEYAMPGTTNKFNINVLHTGVYRGQCTQLCGIYHSLMLFSVKAVTPAQFTSWVHQVSKNSASIGKLKATIVPGGSGA